MKRRMGKTQISRRRFIILLAVTFISVVAGNFLLLSFNQVVGRILSKELSFMKLERTSIDAFTHDIKSNNYYEQKAFDWKKKWFVRFYHYFAWIPILPGRAQYKKFADFFVTDFLLSTDFFLNKMDEHKTVNYIALYEPYKRACSNPFSNLHYPNL